MKSTKNKLTYEEALVKIKAAHDTKIQLVGQFIGVDAKHRFRCNSCMRSWKALFMNVVNSKASGCPHCAKAESPRKQNTSYKFKTVEIQGCRFKVQGYEPQAIEWLLLNHTKIKATDIKVDSSGEVPQIRYKIGRRTRTYFPDLFIPKFNRIVEIKSNYTLGIVTGRNWKKNQAKAKAVIAAGYKFSMLVMEGNGKRLFKLPVNWYNTPRLQVLSKIAMNKDVTTSFDVPRDKLTPITAKALAKLVVATIQAMPREDRVGQRNRVVTKVAETISKYM